MPANINIMQGTNTAQNAGLQDPYTAGSYGYSNSYSYTNPNNELTHQWMMEANAFNAEQAEINRQFQREMSNTAYRRAMRDMEKAGLNPILAGNLGGASTPGGSAASANFTGAGATSSSASSSYQQSVSVKDSLYNFAKNQLEGAIQRRTGQNLSDWTADLVDQMLPMIDKQVGTMTQDLHSANTGSNFKGGSRYGRYMGEKSPYSALARELNIPVEDLYNKLIKPLLTTHTYELWNK